MAVECLQVVLEEVVTAVIIDWDDSAKPADPSRPVALPVKAL